jgi:hypothetical protein
MSNFVGQVDNLPPIENRLIAASGLVTGRLTIGGRLSTCPTNWKND